MADPATPSIFDMEPDAEHEARLDAEAETAYAEGRYVEHSRVREWLIKLAKGERTPPPRAWRMQVVWTEPALDGIALACEYIFEFSPRAAMHVAGTLRTEGDSLEQEEDGGYVASVPALVGCVRQGGQP
jgi:hypothetical protein